MAYRFCVDASLSAWLVQSVTSHVDRTVFQTGGFCAPALQASEAAFWGRSGVQSRLGRTAGGVPLHREAAPKVALYRRRSLSSKVQIKRRAGGFILTALGQQSVEAVKCSCTYLVSWSTMVEYTYDENKKKSK